MPKAIDLLRQGRNEELWQMCCGFINLNIDEFMDVQRRLLEEQLVLLNNCALGEKIMRGARPETVEEFRRLVPLTTYRDYCPELLEKREDTLPAKPSEWVHTSGKTGEYPCKWIPLTADFSRELSAVSYGVGIFSSCRERGDLSQLTNCPRVVYAVAPRPYMSGALAKMVELQSPSRYMPPLEEAESLSFEERIRLGFEQALSQGFDYFFGISLVLVAVGNRFSESSSKPAILPLLSRPRALLRIIRGLVKSKLAGRSMLPRDLWTIKGIISGGLDSWVYRDKIKELWGRYPLDTYTGSEGGIMATQTWDYDSMTFVPNLNFLEFIPEEEHFKWQLDHSYQPRTLLLNELEAGKEYEIVITNFHGGAMIRYRPGDMIRITALRNEKLGIELPQMVFARRADDIIDFGVTRLTERVIWEALENTGIPYEDWIARKETGDKMALHLYVELKDGNRNTADEVADAVYRKILETDGDLAAAEIRGDYTNFIDFRVEATVLPKGTFARYTAEKRAQGADLAHLKPPHINPTEETFTLLVTKPEKVGAAAETPADTDKVVV
ncbi:MAG: GH3 auxin-responsive promoter family protein [Chloroflexota bacterium]